MSILAVAGANGVGKSTFMRAFLQMVPGSALLPSYTTRPMRGSEILWKDISEYYKLAPAEMLERSEEGEFLHVFGREEHNYGALYATRREDFEKALASPHPHLAALFVPGIELFFDEARIRNRMSDMHAVHITLDSEEERQRRLNKDADRDAVRHEPELDKWTRLVARAQEPIWTMNATHASPEELVQEAIEKFQLLKAA